MSSSPAASGSGLVGAIVSRRWRLSRKLGEGGMGEVYAAEPVSGGRAVALKILRRDFLDNGDVRARFLEEGHTCMRLAHPNVVRVTECAQAEDGSPYIVMELLEGVPLSAYMQPGARVPVLQAVPIMAGILNGLAAAHSHGVVHRDLKPENVFLIRDSSGAFAVKVLDFGIAKVMDVAGGMGTRTRTGMLLGTPAYMSPEQARSARDVDQRADLWSAGVLLYEMVTGRVAFPGPTELARLAALISADPEPLDAVDPSLAALGPVVSRALKKNRDERFATASEMLHALLAAVPGSAQRSDAPPARELAPAPAIRGQRASSSTSEGDTRAPSRPSAVVAATVASPRAEVREGPGGTLASSAVPPHANPPPAVVVIARDSSVGASPGPAGPSPSRPGVAPLVVVLLVLAGVLAGLLMGFALGRAT